MTELSESFSDSVDREEDTYYFFNFDYSLEYLTGTNVIEGLASFISD